MKKLLLIIAFTINFASAQNVEYLKQANNSDADFTRKFADDLASSSRTKLIYFDKLIQKRANTTTLIYIPEDTTDEQKEALKAHIIYSETSTGFESENALCVRFTVINEGENKDLDIKGIKRYQFENVEGKFLDLFKFWKTNVDPLADETKITQKGISAIRNNEQKFWYNLSRKSNSNTWILKNYTYRINE